MKKKETYKIINEARLVVQFFSGDIVKDDLLLLQKVMSYDPLYNQNFDIVADFRDANLLLTEDDLVDYVDFIKN